jgi:putative copper export protein
MTLEQLAALLRLLLYAGALTAGGAALAWASLGSRLGGAAKPAPRWIAGGAAAALVAAVAGAALLLWQLGGFDASILAALVGSPSGLALGLQILGGALLLASARRAAALPLRLAGAVALFAAFGANGHAAASSAWSGLLAGVHVLAAGWWLASLLLLRSACRSLPAGELAGLTRHFGRLAIAGIAAMVACGGVLVLVLVPPTREAWLTPYAQNLALKIAFAAAALAVATYARTRLVPRLEHAAPAASLALRRTVTAEIVLIAGTLAATAWLTTFHSPHEYHEAPAAGQEEGGAPAGRAEAFLEPLEGGEDLYAARVRAETTSDLEPDQIHQLGLSEVKRIEGEMLAIARQLGFADLRSFDASLERNPALEAKSGQELVALYRDHLYEMEVRLPLLFGRLPRARLEVVPLEGGREAEPAGAVYLPATPDGSRPGRLAVDTNQATRRQTTAAESAAYREGLPGRHLQLSIQQELTPPPPIRGETGLAAYGEGWALYAEGLAYEVGLLRNPYSRYGKLRNEMLHAIRLVADTGLHAKGWTREQAVQLFREHSALDEAEAQSEVDRCIARPAQGLAAKIGQLKIRELRHRAEKALGSRFDVRRFHDEILGAGPLPLGLLEQRIDAYIAAPPPSVESDSPYGAHSH